VFGNGINVNRLCGQFAHLEGTETAVKRMSFRQSEGTGILSYFHVLKLCFGS
jgi:hypothetical protein